MPFPAKTALTALMLGATLGFAQAQTAPATATAQPQTRQIQVVATEPVAPQVQTPSQPQDQAQVQPKVQPEAPATTEARPVPQTDAPAVTEAKPAPQPEAPAVIEAKPAAPVVTPTPAVPKIVERPRYERYGTVYRYRRDDYERPDYSYRRHAEYGYRGYRSRYESEEHCD